MIVVVAKPAVRPWRTSLQDSVERARKLSRSVPEPGRVRRRHVEVPTRWPSLRLKQGDTCRGLYERAVPAGPGERRPTDRGRRPLSGGLDAAAAVHGLPWPAGLALDDDGAVGLP
jgi:hypothetical protein